MFSEATLLGEEFRSSSVHRLYSSRACFEGLFKAASSNLPIVIGNGDMVEVILPSYQWTGTGREPAGGMQATVKDAAVSVIPKALPLRIRQHRTRPR